MFRPPVGASDASARRFCNRQCAAQPRKGVPTAKRSPEPNLVECACGCGTHMLDSNWWKPRRFILGHNGRKETPERTCAECGKTYAGRRSGDIFCSRACSSRSRINDSRIERTGAKYRHWRKACLERDGFRCRMCDATEHLHVHHVEEFSKNVVLRFDVDNGITVCAGCHSAIHGRRLTRESFAPRQLLLALGLSQ